MSRAPEEARRAAALCPASARSSAPASRQVGRPNSCFLLVFQAWNSSVKKATESIFLYVSNATGLKSSRVSINGNIKWCFFCFKQWVYLLRQTPQNSETSLFKGLIVIPNKFVTRDALNPRFQNKFPREDKMIFFNPNRLFYACIKIRTHRNQFPTRFTSDVKRMCDDRRVHVTDLFPNRCL